MWSLLKFAFLLEKIRFPFFFLYVQAALFHIAGQSFLTFSIIFKNGIWYME